ncbi:MAG: ATP12 family chaperone protein [Geminicoccaceae bacterium]
MKRFYGEAGVIRAEGGHGIRLDDRPVNTPAGHPLVVPTEALGERIAAEWQAQVETVKPETMPVTRLASTAIDLLPERRDDAAQQIADYAETDLLCYRAPEPTVLVIKQSRLWDPVLAWAQAKLGLRFTVVTGVTPVAQDPSTLRLTRDLIDALDDWRLTGLHAATTLTGSVVLGLALERGYMDAAELTAASTLDERFEMERWGSDAEAIERLENLGDNLAATEAYLHLL